MELQKQMLARMKALGVLHPFMRYRRARKLNQTQLAELIGRNAPYVSRVERWNDGVHPRHAVEIEEALKGAITKEELTWPDLYLT